jgi:hypothetical protein
MALGILAWVAIQLVLFVASALLTPKPHFEDATPEDPRGPRTNEGEVLPVIFGTTKVAANICYFGNVQAKEQTEKVKTGFFSSKNVTTGFQYLAVFQAILCHGPVDEIVDIVMDENKSLAATDTGPEVFGPIDADGDSIFESYGVVSGGIVGARTGPALPYLRSTDVTPDDGLILDTTSTEGLFGGYQRGGGMAGRMRFYWGTPLQSVVDPVMVAAVSASQYGSRYEGVCHVVFGNTVPGPLTRFYYGERSILPGIEFILRRCPSNLGLSLAQTNLGGGANPAEIIYECLTNLIWGTQMPASHIDVPSFVAAGTTLATEGMGLNMSINDGQSCDAIISEVLRYIDGQVQQHPVTGLIELTLNRADYVVANLPVVNEGNAFDPQITRPSWSSVKNEVRVIYTARRGVFFKQVPTQPIQDIGSQRNFADVNAVTVGYPAISDSVIANRIGVRDLRLLSTPLGKLRIMVDRTAADFRVGRPFAFNWSDFGIANAVYRVMQVDYGTIIDGKMPVDAVEDIFALEQPMYGVPNDPYYADPVIGKQQQLVIDPVTTDNATTGFLTLNITAGTGLVTSVEFRGISGNRTPGAWHQSESNSSFLGSVDKHASLQSAVEWRINGHKKDGTIGEIAAGSVQFDIQAQPQTPEVVFIPGTVAGRLSATVYVDGDTTSIKYAVSKVGQPSVATTRLATPIVLAPGQTVVNLIDVLTLAPGEEAYITVLAYDAAGNESAPGVINDTITVIYPEMRATPTENGALGTLVLTPVDPQGRLTRVQMAPVLGNAVPVFADVSPVGGTYTQTITLISKQPSRIEYRAYAMVGGVETIVEEKGVRFAIGSLPIQPEVSYQIDADGTLVVKAFGDSDTNLIHFVVALDVAPSKEEIDGATGADNSFAARVASYTYKVGGVVRKLTPGQKFYVAVRAYNTLLAGTLDAKGSTVVSQTDQWVGPSDARATVSVGGTGADSRSVTFGTITLGPLTARVDVFVREYRADPGAIVSIASIGHEAPGSPLYANGSLIIPIANPSNWLLVTFVAIDALNRVGANQVTGLNNPGGTVTIKVQAAAAPATAPAAPTNLTLTELALSSVQLAIVMPASNLPAALRIFRDGVALPDVSRTALAGATQNVTDVGRTPNSSYTYQVYGVSAVGILSAAGSPIRTITLGASTLPKPTLSVGAYAQSQGGFTVTITPAAGTPSGVGWFLEHSTQTSIPFDPLVMSAWTPVENNAAQSFVHGHVPADNFARREDLRVTGKKAGYGDSPVSDPVTTTIPALIFTD